MGNNKRKKGVSGNFNQMGRGVDPTRNPILCIISDSESTNTG